MAKERLQHKAISEVYGCLPDRRHLRIVPALLRLAFGKRWGWARDRRRPRRTDEAGIVENFGVTPESIPAFLAVVGGPCRRVSRNRGMGCEGGDLSVVALRPPGKCPQGLAEMVKLPQQKSPTVSRTSDLPR